MSKALGGVLETVVILTELLNSSLSRSGWWISGSILLRT